MALAKVEHHFCDTYITEEQLNEFDRAITSCLRKIFNINNNTTVRTMFTKKQKGGLGIRKPSIIYRATRINFLIKMLNHPDLNFRYVARHSLSLDFVKRGIPKTDAHRNFLGYKIKDSGTLETNIKGGFGVQSDWPQLFNLVMKINAELKWEKNTEDLHGAGNAQLILKSGDKTKILQSNRIRKEVIEDQLNRELENLKKRPMQGRLVDNIKANYLMSQNIFRNYKLTDEFINFWYKARHNVLPCFYTLSLWYSNQPANCVLDDYRIESTAQVLNGCKNLRGNYSKRHDRIVEKIGGEIKTSENNVNINKTVKTSLQTFGFEIENNNKEDLLKLKPDLHVKEDNRILILDVACPYDLYLAELYELKVN